MPTQVFIIPPKSSQAHKPLGISLSAKSARETSDFSSEPTSPSHEQTKFPSDNKLSMRINPPQLIVDNFSDYDDEDQHFSYRSTIIQRRRPKYQEPLPRIREDELPQSTVAAIVSAPIVELPFGLTGSNTPEHTNLSRRDESSDLSENQGQTLLHLAAKLGHEEIMRVLINETSHINTLLNDRGQIPLLCAIEAGATSTATLLMEQDPLSLTCKDNIGSSSFHYATEQCNDVVLSRAISLLKRLSSSAARITALQRLIEKNANNKTPFVIAIEKGSLKCVKYILSSKWLHRNVEISDFINADSLKTTIDKDQLDIASYFVSNMKRFAAIIQIKINANGRIYNVLEYSIALKKPDFVRIFISVRIPNEERELCSAYKYFLKHYNVPYSGSTYNQTPIQRMLTMSEMIPLVPLLLEQFVGEDGIDLSVIDDCLRARPAYNHCIYGHSKRFIPSNWLKQHPLSLIVEANHAPVYDHDVVKICVDLKFQLFGNFLYLLILCAQIAFVFLYTGVALASPTPPRSYYDTSNYTCIQLCQNLTNDIHDRLPGNLLLLCLRYLLLLCSCIALLKELFQLINQREKYFRDIFINFLEVFAYICGVLFSIDLNSCSQSTGLRCKWQWESGALGITSVWTLLLFVLMNSMKIGKYGLLFTLAMLTGEYDFDDLFFPNGKVLQGSQAAMVLFSIFVFTMNIVIMNIMVGLAVSDVKSFRLNAKREHLRARIETCLGLQSKFGVFCEACSQLVLQLSKRSYLPHFQRHSLKKYHIWKLELRDIQIDIPRTIESNTRTASNRSGKCHTTKERVTCQVGYYRHHIDRAGEPLLQENEYSRLMHKVDELRDVFERSNARVHHELRKLTTSLQSDFDEIKRKLLES
ncbi:hypothetical protein I4U23_014278 [Adineta vaga]|nr:hypothetical protein I4U23_014278 [Adineta vaga]